MTANARKIPSKTAVNMVHNAISQMPRVQYAPMVCAKLQNAKQIIMSTMVLAKQIVTRTAVCTVYIVTSQMQQIHVQTENVLIVVIMAITYMTKPAK